MFKKLNPQKYTVEQGFVSIIVTLILMTVLTLIVLGFAQLSRREQRTALNQQLGTQAFYAAESGANDFKKYLAGYPAAHGGAQAPSQTTCESAADWSTMGLNNKISTTPDVQFTCILYNASIPVLKYNPVNIDQVTVLPLTNSSSSNPIDTLTFSWKSTTNTSTYQPAGSLGNFLRKSGAGSWGNNNATGVLRVMIIPYASGQTRQNYIDRSFTGFFYPAPDGTSSAAYGSGQGNNSGVLLSGDCSASASPAAGCNTTITGLPPSAGGYYVVMRAVYNAVNVEIRGKNGGPTGTTVGLTGAQYVIDVTGKANDVLKRVEIRQPLITTCGTLCPVGFTSMLPICKQIIIDPAKVKNPTDSPIVLPNPDYDCTFKYPT